LKEEEQPQCHQLSVTIECDTCKPKIPCRKSVPEGNNSDFVELAKKLLDTELMNLDVLDLKKYGSWESFMERIHVLKDIVEGKTGYSMTNFHRNIFVK
jgi:hypothetical protein